MYILILSIHFIGISAIFYGTEVKFVFTVEILTTSGLHPDKIHQKADVSSVGM